MITVVGLGIKQGDLSLNGVAAIEGAEIVVVKTALTATYGFFEENQIKHTTMDNFYENAEDFDDLDNQIARYLFSLKDKNVVYCVNGNGADDRSVVALKELCDVNIIAGVSNELATLSLHPSTSVVKVSAYDIAGDKAFSYDKTKPLVVVDIDNDYIASQVKEVLARVVGEECEIIYFNGKTENKILAYELDRQTHFGFGCGVYVSPFAITDKQEYNFGDLLRIMLKLRGKNGCEWDKAQTHESIRKNVIEEAYELVDAIDSQDVDNIIEEAGDVILQGVFHAVIGEDEGEFNANEVLTNLCNKLVTRHTHIFGDVVANNADEALKAWEAAKAKEKRQSSLKDKLQGVAKSLPSLQKAAKYQKYLSKIGMDFKNTNQIKDKILEELQEVFEAKSNHDIQSLEAECGDLLFAVINLLRFFGVDGEVALNKACDKFAKRAMQVDMLCKKKNKELAELSEVEQEQLWQEAKANEDREY